MWMKVAAAFTSTQATNGLIPPCLGAGSYLTTEQADDLYLSKTVDDVAEGAITFRGLTTYEGGVSVTGAPCQLLAAGACPRV